MSSGCFTADAAAQHAASAACTARIGSAPAMAPTLRRGCDSPDEQRPLPGTMQRVSEKPAIGRWRSEDAKERFHATEQAIWDDRGHPQPERLDIQTWAGTTRVYRWGGEGEPIVLLHGMGGTGLSW